ncbi:non-hydrolyzing UDP-N-acetylglucosamine 2-epimerase [Planctomyces sp. SH-PL62]|uniref:non-hydrolyzing UDP-N-acetylglucosamine 2-epimerase n=1 Tax=Planctomyces sp. SH-PL62 TaxID=1636152 RepID=UPI00078BD336|nr:UDP-N-acetylglucosamine 2-epimerase (non-hydrolyzing) [Planctomyces sp. SH-PL62]AMV39247.1 UDP-2,3-diacetamido-2,3-dideoxy-D-glucuronate 2-epimerase [Planctomyces sp. SH-PL62]
MKIVLVAGARPNFIKIAPLMKELRGRDAFDVRLVHTGQHYDERMSRLFFEELEIPRPDVDLGVGSASHAVQTAEVMKRFEPILQSETPDAVVVVGDVNSTLACTLTAAKMNIPVAHVEAGLRSFDRTMPEEINRILTDAISTWLFVSERSGLENLRRDGIPEERIHFVGNVMIDTLEQHRATSERSKILQGLELQGSDYAVLTLHRPASVDDPTVLSGLMAAVGRISKELPVVFPVHPRTAAILRGGGPHGTAGSGDGLRLVDPLGYLDFLKLLSNARFVMTDSGGIQEETTVLGVPCLTLRTSTERPATISEGTNQLVGLDPDHIVATAMDVFRRPKSPRKIPEFWDGRASRRIADILEHA